MNDDTDLLGLSGLVRYDKHMAELYGALAKAQGEFPEIAKNRSVKIRMKSGGEYNFRYADLQAIISATKPALSKHGLCMIQQLGSAGQRKFLKTVLAHEGGGVVYDCYELPEPADNDPKTLGALVTYFRRYCYSAIVGVSADDDLDERNTGAGDEAASEALVAEMTAAANKGTAEYKWYWLGLTDNERRARKALHAGMKRVAAEADKTKAAAAHKAAKDGEAT